MPICTALGCGCWDRLIVDDLCMPLTERIRGSRMREIRTSGLTRGEEAVSLPLPYSTRGGPGNRSDHPPVANLAGETMRVEVEPTGPGPRAGGRLEGLERFLASPEPENSHAPRRHRPPQEDHRPLRPRRSAQGHRTTHLRLLSAEDIRDFFAGLGPFRAVVEATASYEWLVALIEPLAEAVLLAHPGKLRVIAESVKKTDRLDAQVLAEFLARDMIPRAHRPTAAAAGAPGRWSASGSTCRGGSPP